MFTFCLNQNGVKEKTLYYHSKISGATLAGRGLQPRPKRFFTTQTGNVK